MRILQEATQMMPVDLSRLYYLKRRCLKPVCVCQICNTNEAYYQVDSLSDLTYDRVVCKSCWERIAESEKIDKQLEVTFIRY